MEREFLSISDKAIDLWAQYVECPGESFCRQAIEDEVSRLLGCDFTVHEHTCGGKNCSERCTYRMLAAGAHTLAIGQAQLAKDGREVCGDSGGSVMLDEGRQLLMISDGMGVGGQGGQRKHGSHSYGQPFIRSWIQAGNGYRCGKCRLVLTGQ